MGRYTQHLKCNADLIVENSMWYIEYIFPGPDGRFNCSIVDIKDKDIDRYISAWKNNLEKYLELKSSFGMGGKYEVEGEAGMTITVGSYDEGVYLHHRHRGIKTQEKLDETIRDYEMCKEKAPIIQKMIKELK